MKNTKNGRNLGKALLMGTALVTLSSHELEAATFTSVGAMSAIILTPIAVSTTQPLHFGSITVGTATGTVVQPTDGTARSTTGAVALVTGAGLQSQGELIITAATGVVMDVAMTAPTFTVDDAGAGLAMNVDTFNLKTNAGGTAVTTSIGGPATNVVVPVGATLNVPAGQRAATAGITPATFTGNYSVTVDYQ